MLEQLERLEQKGMLERPGQLDHKEFKV